MAGLVAPSLITPSTTMANEYNIAGTEANTWLEVSVRTICCSD